MMVAMLCYILLSIMIGFLLMYSGLYFDNFETEDYAASLGLSILVWPLIIVLLIFKLLRIIINFLWVKICRSFDMVRDKAKHRT